MKIPLPTIRRRARIEIIPLIDIVFFLLATFVMVSLSMVKNQGILVNLPAATTSAALDRSNLKTITIKETGEIYLDKVAFSQSEIIQRLAAFKSQDPDLKVLINGDEKASLGDAIGILDEVRKLGISKVAVQTKK